MSENPSSVYGIVFYTISDDGNREAFHNYLKDELKCTAVDESSYGLIETGDGSFAARDAIMKKCKEIQFSRGDFVRICFSGALTNGNMMHDRIAMYHIVENGTIEES